MCGSRHVSAMNGMGMHVESSISVKERVHLRQV